MVNLLMGNIVQPFQFEPVFTTSEEKKQPSWYLVLDCSYVTELDAVRGHKRNDGCNY